MVNIEIKLISFLYSWRWRNCIQSAKIRSGADCGSDHQLLIVKFRLKLKKTGKNTKPASYALNQILCEFSVEVMNRFNGLNIDNTAPEELWTAVFNIIQEVVNKTIPKKKKARGKVFIWRGFTNSKRMKTNEKQAREGKVHPIKCRFKE